MAANAHRQNVKIQSHSSLLFPLILVISTVVYLFNWPNCHDCCMHKKISKQYETLYVCNKLLVVPLSETSTLQCD